MRRTLALVTFLALLCAAPAGGGGTARKHRIPVDVARAVAVVESYYVMSTAGDLWGSLGAWASGRWHDANAETYIAKVRQALDARTWETENFRRYYTVGGRPVDSGPR